MMVPQMKSSHSQGMCSSVGRSVYGTETMQMVTKLRKFHIKQIFN